jgi:hypothetical protein
MFYILKPHMTISLLSIAFGIRIDMFRDFDLFNSVMLSLILINHNLVKKNLQCKNIEFFLNIIQIIFVFSIKLAYAYLLLLDIIIHYEVFHYLIILQS